MIAPMFSIMTFDLPPQTIPCALRVHVRRNLNLTGVVFRGNISGCNLIGKPRETKEIN
jgi:hypothetical protein